MKITINKTKFNDIAYIQIKFLHILIYVNNQNYSLITIKTLANITD